VRSGPTRNPNMGQGGGATRSAKNKPAIRTGEGKVCSRLDRAQRDHLKRTGRTNKKTVSEAGESSDLPAVKTATIVST